MICKNCGANIESDSKFCAFCGCKCESENEAENALNMVVQNNIVEPVHEDKIAENNNKNSQTEQQNIGIDIREQNNETAENDNHSASETETLNKTPQIDYSYSASANVVDTASSALSFGGQKKKVLIAAGAAIASILAVILILFALTSNLAVKKMDKALDTHSAYEVNSLYSRASGNSKKTEKYDKAIAAFLNEVENDLNNKTYNDDDLKQNGYTVVYRDLSDDWGDLIYSENGDTIKPSVSGYNQHAWDIIQAIIDSRSQYCSGVAYRDNYQKPKEAIECFENVTEEDSFYQKVDDEISKCVDLYVEQTLAEAQKFIDNGNISDALSKIESINTYLEKLGLNSDTVQQKLKETKVKYAETYAKKAEDCFNNKDVNGAIGNIEVAIELAPDNADYKTKKDTYEMYIPFNLYVKENCLSVAKENDHFWGILEFDKTKKSNDNKDMNHSLTWYNNNNDSTASIIATYNLSGKYDTVSGVIYLFENNKDASDTGYFEAYGDGKLIYTSPKITKNVLPQNVSFSVTGIQKLELKFYGQGKGGFYGTGSNFGLSNLTASKDFPEN